MKTPIKLVALFLLLGTGAFASTPLKSHNKGNMHDRVSLIPLHASRGFAVLVDKAEAGNSEVIIYDNDNNAVFKDRLSKGSRSEKKYILSNLENGTYTVEVFSKNHDVKTKFCIYNKGEKRIVDII